MAIVPVWSRGFEKECIKICGCIGMVPIRGGHGENVYLHSVTSFTGGMEFVT